jgi:hypothetical protein
VQREDFLELVRPAGTNYFYYKHHTIKNRGAEELTSPFCRRKSSTVIGQNCDGMAFSPIPFGT